jgi:hypothetical protein
VRWELVEDHRQLQDALLARIPPQLSAPTAVQRVREEVFECYARSDLPGMVARWESQPYEPASPAEAAVLAFAMARLERGRVKVEPLLSRVRADLPAEAEVIEALLDWSEGRTRQTADRLVAVLARLRDNPWIMMQASWEALNAAENLARQEPSQAAKLYAALSQPFAAEALSGVRCLAALHASESIGPAATVQALVAFEPYVPWDEAFLVARQRAYEATGHALAAQAARDVDEYRRNAPRAKFLTER